MRENSEGHVCNLSLFVARVRGCLIAALSV